MQLSDYIAQVQFLIHDQTNQDFSQAELIAAVNNARQVAAVDFQAVRVTYLTAPYSISNPGAYNPVGIIAGQELYYFNNAFASAGASIVNGGVIVGATVLAGGANYSSATTVTFAAGPTGSVPATGVPVIQNGVIQYVNMTQWGQGYPTAVPGTATASQLPAVTFTDPGGGTGAVAEANIFNNVFNVLSISNIWGNQRYMLKYRAFILFQAYMRSQLFFRQRPLIWTTQEEQGFVIIQPPPDQPYQTEWDTVCLPQNMTAVSDLETQILGPAQDAVQYWAAHLCLTKMQNFNQAEYMQTLYSRRVPKIIIGKNGVRIPNPYNKTFQRRVMR
jgi:hypothetical protein